TIERPLRSQDRRPREPAEVSADREPRPRAVRPVTYPVGVLQPVLAVRPLERVRSNTKEVYLRVVQPFDLRADRETVLREGRSFEPHLRLLVRTNRNGGRSIDERTIAEEMAPIPWAGRDKPFAGHHVAELGIEPVFRRRVDVIATQLGGDIQALCEYVRRLQ